MADDTPSSEPSFPRGRKQKPALIAVIGSLTHDLIFQAARMPAPGESLGARSLESLHGGKGANMAVAAHRASHRRPGPATGSPGETRVFMNGAVGRDDVGPALREGLRAQGVDVRGVLVREGERTGTVVIVLEDDAEEKKKEESGGGQSRCLGFKGANATFGLEEAEGLEGLVAREGRPDLVITHLTMAVTVVERALEMAAGAGVDTVLSASPAVALPERVYGLITHLILNEHEAVLLSGSSARDMEHEKSLRGVAGGFVQRGVRNVVITLGHRGAYYATSDGRSGLVPAEKVEAVVDATGAGDTFVGSYAAECVRQKQESIWDIQRAVALASRAAACTIRQLGAQTSMPWMDEIA